MTHYISYWLASNGAKQEAGQSCTGAKMPFNNYMELEIIENLYTIIWLPENEVTTWDHDN